MEIFTDEVQKLNGSSKVKHVIIHGVDREYVSFTYGGKLHVHGSLRPSGGKPDNLKEKMKIPQNTWVCHFYYTYTNGVYIGENLAFTVEGMMKILSSATPPLIISDSS
tara:strand:+ start:130 stop:453 length:324 start_codon:yes stop_codon:yes gene_type:complete